MGSRVRSMGSQSELEWRAGGCHLWWCRVGVGRGARFIRLAPGGQAGNAVLDALVDLPVGTLVSLGIGAGPAVETARTVPKG